MFTKIFTLLKETTRFTKLAQMSRSPTVSAIKTTMGTVSTGLTLSGYFYPSGKEAKEEEKAVPKEAKETKEKTLEDFLNEMVSVSVKKELEKIGSKQAENSEFLHGTCLGAAGAVAISALVVLAVRALSK